MSFESINIIIIMLLALFFSIIFFMFGSSFYMLGNDYANIQAEIINSQCVPILNTKSNTCNLTITYTIDANKVTNHLIINSNILYKTGDIINIKYDKNNYLNITTKTSYNTNALIFSLSGLIFLCIFTNAYNEITQKIIYLINVFMSYLSFIYPTQIY